MAARVLAWRGDTADQGSGTAWGGAHLVPARRRCPCRRAAQAHHPRPQNGRVRLPQRQARPRPERARGPYRTRRRRSSRRTRGRPRSAPATASSRPRGPPRPLRPARRPPGRAPRLRRVSTARRPQASSRGLCLAAGPLAQRLPGHVGISRCRSRTRCHKAKLRTVFASAAVVRKSGPLVVQLLKGAFHASRS